MLNIYKTIKILPQKLIHHCINNRLIDQKNSAGITCGVNILENYRRLMETFFNIHLFMDWLPKVNGDLHSLFLPTKLQNYLYLHLFY